MDEIIDNLYLGNQIPAEKIDYLQLWDITHILVVGKELKVLFPEHFEYKKIEVDDDEKEELVQTHLESCISFIENALENKKKVYVHCAAGVSRSPTIVIGYLMWKRKITFDDAIKLVRKSRSIVSPNRGFIEQLRNFEKKILIQDKNIYFS